MTPQRHPHPLLYHELLRRALAEDLGGAGDLTTDAVVAEGSTAQARFVARQPGRIAGLDVALDTLRLLDPRLETDTRNGDAADVEAGAVLATVHGRTRALLSGERVALNFLGRLSGIATATRGIVRAVESHGAKVVATRKTTPGLRALEKYAVRVGGGADHRFGLDDAILIKDNHIACAGGLASAVERARAAAGHMVRIEVEVDDLEQLREVLALDVGLVLLDNLSLAELRKAVALNERRAILEASGGITPANAAQVAATGVDVLSLGWLTHSAAALDVAMEIVV